MQILPLNSFAQWVIFLLGFATFLPSGITYVVLLGWLPVAVYRFKTQATSMDTQWKLLLALLLIWPFTSLLLDTTDDFASRYGHTIRVGLCILLGLSLREQEKGYLLRGLLAGGVFALTVILFHNLVHSLPRWTIWHQMLIVQGNASSQKWIMLALLSATSLTLACYSESSKKRWLFGSLALLSALTVATYSASRNSYVVLLAAGVAAMLFVIRDWKRSAIWSIPVVSLSFALLSLSSAAQYRLNLLVLELNRYMTEGYFMSSVGVRAHMYVTAWNEMWTHWFLGNGLGSWKAIWLSASTAYPKMAMLHNPHNDFLLWGVELGLVGMATLVLIIMKMTRDAWHYNTPTSAVGWIMAWGLAITALFNAPFRDGALGMSMIILGVALSSRSTYLQKRTPLNALPGDQSRQVK